MPSRREFPFLSSHRDSDSGSFRDSGIAAGILEGRSAAEIRGVRLHKRGIEIVLTNQQA
jgi:hypothetical protein